MLTKHLKSKNSSRIAILHLVHHFAVPGIGGFVRVLLPHLDQHKYVWHVGALSGRGTLRVDFRHLGAQVVDFSATQNGSINKIKNIREYVESNNIGIVHSHSVRTTLAAAAALVGVSQTIHLATEHLFYSPQDRRWGLAYTLLDRFSLYLPDHIVAISHRMYNQIVALPRLNPMRITIIQTAVDCEAFYTPRQRDPCRIEFGLPPESQVIGFIGRLDKQKRVELLLEGFVLVLARHPEARMMIVGKGSLRPRLESLAARMGISHAVIWTGFRQDIPRLLAAMDIYVLPSSNEGFSASMLEALAACKPVIVTDVGGAQDVITDGKTGILIPPGSASAIGNAIIDLLDHPKKCNAIAQAGRARAVKEFGVQRLADAYQDVYRSLAISG